MGYCCSKSVHVNDDFESDSSQSERRQNSGKLQESSYCAPQNESNQDTSKSALLDWSDTKDELGNLPPRIPPAKKKYEILKPSEYHSWQKRAINYKESTNQLSTLVENLTCDAQTPLQKICAIYTWITIQDLSLIDETSFSDLNTPNGCLAAIKIEALSYHYTDLLKQLCQLAGIPCYEISGCVKGAGYEPGDSVEHLGWTTWNAVLVDDYWRLLDVHWGARSESGCNENDKWQIIDSDANYKSLETKKEIVYEKDDFYFLSDPEMLIYSHYPDDSQWQLLDNPISIEDFESQAYLTGDFFKFGLSIKSHPKVHIMCPDGNLSIQFALPMKRELGFLYELYSLDTTAEKNNNPLRRYAFQQYINKIISFEVYFPQPEKYFLKIFAGEYDVKNISNGICTNHICSYVISCTNASNTTDPLPENLANNCFGPRISLVRKCLEPTSHTSGVIITNDGSVEIKFKMKGESLNFLHSLSSNNYSRERLIKHAIHRIINDEVIFSIALPGCGRFAFDIRGSEVSVNSFSHLCSYLIMYEKSDVEQKPFPLVPNMSYGIVDRALMKKHKINVERSDPMVTSIGGEVKLNFHCEKMLQYTTQLKMQDRNEEIDFADYVFIDQVDNSTEFSADLPKPGYYKLQVKVQNSTKSGKFSPIYNFLIHCDEENNNCLEFPERCHAWYGCQLLEPRYRSLPIDEDVNFSLIFPTAKQLAVIRPNEGTWIQFDRDPEGIWNRTVNTGKFPGELVLMAKIKDDSYTNLLKYKVVDKKTTDELREKHFQIFEIEEEDEELLENENLLEIENNEETERRKEVALTAEQEEKSAIAEELQACNEVTEAKKEEKRVVGRKAKIKAANKVRLAKRKALERKHNRIKKQLKVAMKKQNKEAIENAVTEFVNNDVPDLSGEYSEARELLYFFEVRKELVQAMRTRDIDSLQKALDSVHSAPANVQKELVLEKMRADRILKSMKSFERLRHAIMDLDNKTIAEIKSYSAPPKEVHEIFRATYCVLGYSKKQTKRWTNILFLIGKLGKESLKVKIDRHNIMNTSIKSALEAEEMLNGFTLNGVRVISSGAAAFFVWTKRIISEVKQIQEDEAMMNKYDSED